eukprot:7354655-Prymnesium_polylepis.2
MSTSSKRMPASSTTTLTGLDGLAGCAHSSRWAPARWLWAGSSYSYEPTPPGRQFQSAARAMVGEHQLKPPRGPLPKYAECQAARPPST